MAGICIQCAKCLKILSDSTALVLSDAAKNILAVKGASCVVVDEERIQDETDGGDSEYSRARCENCDALVGRLYNRVGEANARVRDLLCLDTAAVCSYQLGSHELKCAGHEQTPTISGGGGNGSQGGVSVDEDRVRRLEEQMVKVENVLVLFNERVGAMESVARATQQRIDALSAHASEPVAWGGSPVGGGGGGGGSLGGFGGGGSGGGVGMPSLPGAGRRQSAGASSLGGSAGGRTASGPGYASPSFGRR